MFSVIRSIPYRIIWAYQDIFALIKRHLISSKYKNSSEWKNLHIKVDWLNRPYTVINFRPEEKFSEYVEEDQYLKRRLSDATLSITEWFLSHNIGDYIKWEVTKIPGYNSYFVRYRIAFQYLTIFRIIRDPILIFLAYKVSIIVYYFILPYIQKILW
jgi:hypothetical protein